MMNNFQIFWKKCLDLHQMNDCDDVNFYYKKFLHKLSKICLKIFLPLLSLVYLCTLFLCRLILSSKSLIDIRTWIFLFLTILSFVLLIPIRFHTKWRTIWILTRLILVLLLILPLLLTYQTEQFHILLSTISILLIYSFLTFTLIQSLIISLSISILYLVLFKHQWHTFELFVMIFYHLFINITGLYIYIRSIKHIRRHFYAYKTNLLEKNQANIDCKKLNTILRYCPSVNSTSINSISKLGTILNCSISLNNQTRLHTSDEFASLIDVLFCQIEQLILQTQPNAYYLFDNETFLILIFDENQNEEINIQQSCQLALELIHFIRYVNQLTQWNLMINIGIDYNQIDLYSNEFLLSSISNYTRWLREECLNPNSIFISPKIYQILQTDSSYQFSSIQNQSIYVLYHPKMFDKSSHISISMNTSDMIDQLTRIQAEYYVEKHLGTITLTRSLRKRSLFQLTSKYMSWFSLNFKEDFLSKDFQLLYRIDRPNRFVYLFILFILFISIFQSFILHHTNVYYLIIYPLIILILIISIFMFYSSIRIDKTETTKKFYVYLNILICLTISILIFVGIQYQSIQNFKYVFHKTNQTTIDQSFDRQYHQYLILAPLYPLYFCTLFRQCSWLIKTFFLLICSILQLYIFEYVWLTTNIYMSSITILHHYTTFSLIVIHNFLLIFLTYVHEWLEKIDFLWLKQMDNERLLINRQKNQLIHQLNLIFPKRVINYYLNTKSLTQHYHFKYEQIGFLYLQFHLVEHQNETILIDFIQNIDYLMKTNEQYSNIVMHKKSTVKELIFSMDLSNSLSSIQLLIEFLFYINERLKFVQINLTACVHIGQLNEILIHFSKFPKIDIWSEHLSFLQLILSKIQLNHCLVTSSVYNLLNDVYLYRTAGSIQNTSMNIETNTTIYFLLGRLIGENLFQGRNTLPIIINQESSDLIRKSSSTDESQFSQHQLLQKEKNSSSITTTTSSYGIGNDQQNLIKQSSSSSSKKTTQTSYRQSLLLALKPTIESKTENNCLVLTQNHLLNGSNSLEQQPKNDEHHQLKPSQSISTTNEETISSFSGWGDDPQSASLLPTDIKVLDGYYPAHPCDLSFTVNMKTADTKSIVSTRTPSPTVPPSRTTNCRPIQFNLARKLVADTSESEMSVHQHPWMRNSVYQSRNLPRTRLSSSYNNLSKTPRTIGHADFLQRWLEDQLNQFRTQIKQTPPLIPRKSNRFSTIQIDSTDEESDTLQENTYPILNSKSTKRPYNHVRYKPLRKNSHLIRHESLKARNRPLLFEKYSQRHLDSTSMPRSDLSDLESLRPDNLSESVLSNLESEYDNMGTNGLRVNKTTTTTTVPMRSSSQIITDESDEDTTFRTTINRCYF